MHHRVVMYLRLVALLVLITSACDYCAFDVWDSTAPMSLTRSEAIRDFGTGSPDVGQERDE